MARFSADQARQLSRWFHDLSVELGNYRFDHWNDLSPTRRKALEDAQWSLEFVVRHDDSRSKHYSGR